MAKTVDDLVLNIKVEGSAQITEASTAADKLSTSIDKTGAAAKQSSGNIRNVAFQIQDLAVQIAGGTSAFVAFGQQLPQLLGGFGVMGAVIGAVAAIAIPLFRVGLSALGFDMRDLQERTSDLEKSTKAFQAAQLANLPTLAGLGSQFGSLTSAAKDFFVVQQQVTERKAFLELASTIKEVKKEYGFLSDEAYKAAQSTALAQGAKLDTSIMGAPVKGILLAASLGLSIEQARELGNRLQELDNNAPEKNLKVITETSFWLKETIKDADKERKIFEGVIEPLFKVNNLILESKKNLTESASRASDLAAKILGIQNSYGLQIGSAKRANDQILAARLTAAEKIKEYEAQAADKTAQDGVSREREVAAFKVRANQEATNSIKDFQKAQNETYITANLNNVVKSRQLNLESDILRLQDAQRYSLSYQVQYEEDKLKNANDYQNALDNIDEQQRKNIITEVAANNLRIDAGRIQAQADSNAATARTKRINDAADVQKASIFELNTKIQSVATDEKLLSIQVSMRNVYPEKIALAQKIASLTADQAAQELKINEQKNLGKISDADAAAQIAKTKEALTALVALEEKRTAEALRRKTGTGLQGAQDALGKIALNNVSEFEKAGAMVDSVYQNMNNAIDTFVTTGKFKFGDFARSVIQDLIKIQLKAQATQFFTMMGNSLLTSFGLPAMVPGKAVGGPVNAGSPYIIGERGAELFIPRSAGNIVPNNQLSMMGNNGGSTNVTYNIQAADAASFRQMLARDPEFLYNLTEQTRKSMPARRRQ